MNQSNYQYSSFCVKKETKCQCSCVSCVVRITQNVLQMISGNINMMSITFLSDKTIEVLVKNKLYRFYI